MAASAGGGHRTQRRSTRTPVPGTPSWPRGPCPTRFRRALRRADRAGPAGRRRRGGGDGGRARRGSPIHRTGSTARPPPPVRPRRAGDRVTGRCRAARRRSACRLAGRQGAPSPRAPSRWSTMESTADSRSPPGDLEPAARRTRPPGRRSADPPSRPVGSSRSIRAGQRWPPSSTFGPVGDRQPGHQGARPRPRDAWLRRPPREEAHARTRAGHSLPRPPALPSSQPPQVQRAPSVASPASGSIGLLVVPFYVTEQLGLAASTQSETSSPARTRRSGPSSTTELRRRHRLRTQAGG